MAPNALPPLLKNLDLNDIILKKTKSHYGTMFKVCNSKGEDVMFYFGKGSTVFGAQQDFYNKDKTIPIPADKSWIVNVQVGWENSRTEEQDDNVKKLDELHATVIRKLTELPEADQLVDENNDPLTEEQLRAMIRHPVKKNNRSKSKMQWNAEKGRNEFIPYEPIMKWVVPFGFIDGTNRKDCTRFYKKKMRGYPPFKVFVDENDNEIDGSVENVKAAIPPRSEIEIWGKLASIFIGEKSSMKFETLMVKRIHVEEMMMGQEIDTTDYVSFIGDAFVGDRPKDASEENEASDEPRETQ